jgi:hypothetical protein
MDITNITKDIHVDVATNKGSVIDVIRLVITNKNSSHAGQVLIKLMNDVPELNSSVVQHIRINGKGRLTPVADAKTLVEIVWALPGRAAREFRRTSASTV